MMYLYEGGNVFDNTADVAKDDVAGIIATVQRELPSSLQKQMVPNIGSAGFKVASGDIDVFLDERALLKNFGVEDVKQAKQALGQYFNAKGYAVKLSGRNVHVDVPYKASNGKDMYAQVDIMVIADAKRVADWHQHGPRGMYDEPNFKAGHLYILLNSIAKFLGLKVDAFAGTVARRDNNEIVADNRDAAAKILLNPSARAADLNSVGSVMRALESDPDKEGKLAQARQDAQKGVLSLPETITPGTAAWFRKMGHQL
jgi:hypothetical protein